MNPQKDPELGRRERKKLATQLTIIDVAMNLFKKQGFHETSMEQIADESDVAKATLYKHFPVKEAIIAAYWQQEVKDSKDELQQIIRQYPDTRRRLDKLFRSFMSRIMKSKELYEIYLSYRMRHITSPEINNRLRSGVAENAAEIISAGQDSGELRNDMPLNLLVGHLEMLSVIQSMAWLREPEKFSLESSSKMFVDLFLNGAAKHAKQ